MLPNVGVHNVRGIAFGDHSIDRSLSARSTCELQTNSGPQSCLSRRLQVSTRVLPNMWERRAVQEFRRPWLAMAGPTQKLRRPKQHTRHTLISTRRHCARSTVTSTCGRYATVADRRSATMAAPRTTRVLAYDPHHAQREKSHDSGRAKATTVAEPQAKQMYNRG